jgi:hypothetical protein
LGRAVGAGRGDWLAAADVPPGRPGLGVWAAACWAAALQGVVAQADVYVCEKGLGKCPAEPRHGLIAEAPGKTTKPGGVLQGPKC